MNIKTFTFSAFAIMFLSYAFAPFYVAAIVIAFTFSLLVSVWVVRACRAAYQDDPSLDIYDQNFVSLDDVPRYTARKKHPGELKPIAKIDVRC